MLKYVLQQDISANNEMGSADVSSNWYRIVAVCVAVCDAVRVAACVAACVALCVAVCRNMCCNVH